MHFLLTQRARPQQLAFEHLHHEVLRVILSQANRTPTSQHAPTLACDRFSADASALARRLAGEKPKNGRKHASYEELMNEHHPALNDWNL
jgi:hypothetical protein